MKVKNKKALLSVIAIAILVAVWSVGFLMRNAFAARRNAEVEIFKDVVFWNDLQNGDFEAAKNNCRVCTRVWTFISERKTLLVDGAKG